MTYSHKTATYENPRIKIKSHELSALHSTTMIDVHPVFKPHVIGDPDHPIKVKRSQHLVKV